MYYFHLFIDGNNTNNTTIFLQSKQAFNLNVYNSRLNAVKEQPMQSFNYSKAVSFE